MPVGRRVEDADPGRDEKRQLAGIAGAETVPRTLTVKADSGANSPLEFEVTVRIDTPKEQRYFRHGGILQYVLRELLS